MHEVVTLQLGQRSNYLATHFWNIQESYFTYSGDEQSPVNHDIHFRPGVGADGSETFTPRTLIYDLKGGFGSLKKLNALYDLTEEQGAPKGLWDGKVTTQKQTPIQQHEYQRNLDEGLEPPTLTAGTVRYWSDFNRVFYHPRSIVQLNEYELNSSIMPFERWDSGEDLFKNLDKEHDLFDRDLRPFAEECDQLQAIQMFTTADDAWGGFAARYIDRIRDEFGKTSIWVWAMEGGEKVQREKKLLKTANTARSVLEVSTQASLYIPIADPPTLLPSYVQLNRESEWYSSALLATAVESVAISSRLKGATAAALGSIEGALNINGSQKITQLQFEVADPSTLEVSAKETKPKEHDPRMEREGQDMDYDDEDGAGLTDAPGNNLDVDLFSVAGERQRDRGKKVHVFGRADTFRGSWDIGDEHPEHYKARRRLMGLLNVEKYRTPLLFPMLDSFPKLYTVRAHSSEPVAVHASLSTTSSISEHILSLSSIAARSLELDEREALTNGLGEICEAYQEGWDSDDDEDEDM